MAEATMTLQVTPIVGQSPDIKDIVAALVKAQGDIHHAKKNQENEHFDSSYADLSAVIDALKEPFKNNGLCYTQLLSKQDGAWVVTTRLLHTSGQWFESVCPVLADKQNAHSFGSGVTYARRFSLAAIAGVTQQDDDGNKAAAGKQNNGQQQMPNQNQSRQQQQNNGGKKQTAPPKGPPTINADQAKAMFDAGERLGLTAENVRDIMIAFHGVEKSAMLTVPQWKDVCDRMGKTDAGELGRQVMERLAERQMQKHEAEQRNEKMPE